MHGVNLLRSVLRKIEVCYGPNVWVRRTCLLFAVCCVYCVLYELKAVSTSLRCARVTVHSVVLHFYCSARMCMCVLARR